MLILISPAKTLDFESPVPTSKATQPAFLSQAQQLNGTLRHYSATKLEKLMGVSKAIAELNVDRNHHWQLPFTLENARQAIFAFKGDVYTGLEAEQFSATELTYAQKHLRILSGLYGVLRPLDLMQAYRLEMGTKLKTGPANNLYQFWGDQVTQALNDSLKREKMTVAVNLASHEYFSVVRPELLSAEIVTPVFKDYKNGQYKIISFFAKKARGRMTAWIIKNRIQDTATLKQYALDGYHYCADESDEQSLVFLRDAK